MTQRGFAKFELQSKLDQFHWIVIIDSLQLARATFQIAKQMLYFIQLRV